MEAELKQTLEQKQDELQSLKQLEQVTATLVQQLEAVADKFDTLSDGTKVAAETVARWGEVFNLVSAREKGELVRLRQAGEGRATEAAAAGGDEA